MALSDRTQDAVLLALQAGIGAPRSANLESATDPLSPPTRTTDLLWHFHPSVYDTSDESHLSRFLKVLLGDSSIGSLRKRYFVARMSSIISTQRYFDLDRLFGYVMGLRRLTTEQISIGPYFTATPDEWDAIDARDSSYRARIQQFARAIQLGGTPAGLQGAAQAILGGTEVRVYESYLYLDADNTSYATGHTYGFIEENYTYDQLNGAVTYSEMEGGSSFYRRGTENNRGEVIIRPKRALTEEEKFHLTRTLGRIKPANVLLTIDGRGVAPQSQMPLRKVSADSTYWEVQSAVAVQSGTASAYGSAIDDSIPRPQSRPAMSGYQGQAWSYNADMTGVTSYTLDDQGNQTPFDYERNDAGGVSLSYTPDLAVMDPTVLLLGRMASDGVMVASPYSPGRQKTGAQS